MRRSLPVLTLLVALTSASACHTDARARAPEASVEMPSEVDDFDAFIDGLNQYARLGLDDPARASARASLSAWAIDYIGERIDAEGLDEAQRALEVLVSMWSPAELRAGVPEPELTAVARRLYDATAREGRESGSTFALAAVHQFGAEADRDYAQAQFEELAAWIARSANYAREPGGYLDLETVLEESIALFPSPWLIERLSGYLMDSYHRVGQGAAGGLAPSRHAEYIGYILARAHLRADDPESALAALRSVEGNEETDALAQMLERSISSKKRDDALRELMAYFEPSGDAPLPAWVETQSWGIVELLARRLLDARPNDADALLALGRALSRQSLTPAAIHYYERAVELEPDRFAAWPELAALYQIHLESLSASNPEKAKGLLPALEDFHREAARRWRDRPVEPGLPRAYMTVASSMYSDGHGDQALALAEASMAIEPTPMALDLIGTIAYKRGESALAREAYDRLFELSFDGAAERMDWEIAAHLRLSEIEADANDAAAARRHLKAALRQLNGILGYPQLDPGNRITRHLERGEVLYALGDLDSAMSDFRSAISIAPGYATAYADPVMLLATHGNYAEAGELYARALTADEVDEGVKLYMSLWILGAGDHSGKTETTSAKEFIVSYASDDWTGALAAHARGELAFAALLEQAGDAGEKAEAYFYEALALARAGQREPALEMMSKVIDTGMMSFFEYEMARQYLVWKDIPQSARAPAAAEAAPSAGR